MNTNNWKSGEPPMKTGFSHAIDVLLENMTRKEDSIQPDVKRSAGKVEYKDLGDNSSSDYDSSPKKLKIEPEQTSKRFRSKKKSSTISAS